MTIEEKEIMIEKINQLFMKHSQNMQYMERIEEGANSKMKELLSDVKSDFLRCLKEDVITEIEESVNI